MVGIYDIFFTAKARIIGPGGYRFLIYTDASYEADLDTGGLGAVVIDRLNFISSGNRVGAIFESIASQTSMACFRHSSIIFGLEMAALRWGISPTGEWIRGKNLLIFIDNDAVLCCFARSASGVETSDRYVAALWWLFDFLDVRVWFERAASKDNQADIPSRGLPFDLFDANRYRSFSREGELYELMDSIVNSKVVPPLHPSPL